MTYVGNDEPLVDDFPQAAPAADWIAAPPIPARQDWIDEAPARVWHATPAPRLPADVFDQETTPDPAETVAGYIERTAVDDQLVDDELPVVQVHGVGFLSRWLTSNPVRVWLYGVLLAVLAILVAKGLLTRDDSFLWLALGSAVLGVPLTEAVRGSVYSPRGAAALATRAVAEDRGAR